MNDKQIKYTDNEVTKSSLIDYLKIIGPGLIVSAVVVGPGSVTTMSSMGASYGYMALWLIVFACFSSFFYQESAIRIVMNKQETVISAIRNNISPALAKIVFVLAYIMTLFAQAGNFIGAGMAMNYFVPQLSIIGWASIMIIMALAIVFLKKFHYLDNFTKIMVFMMVISFIITAFAAKPNVSAMITEGFSFKIPGGQWMLAIALIGTTMVADTPLALSTLNKEKYFTPGTKLYNLPRQQQTKYALTDLVISLIVTGLISASILVCAATVLHPQGIQVKSAADMAIQLTPFLGKFAGILFSLGLWAAAFSSGAYRIKLMPIYYIDAWDIKDNEAITLRKVIQLFAGLVPLLILILFGGSPIQLIIVVQTVVGILLPVITVILGILLNKKSYLGDKVNSLVQNIAFLILAVVTTSLAVRLFINIFS